MVLPGEGGPWSLGRGHAAVPCMQSPCSQPPMQRLRHACSGLSVVDTAMHISGETAQLQHPLALRTRILFFANSSTKQRNLKQREGKPLVIRSSRPLPSLQREDI